MSFNIFDLEIIYKVRKSCHNFKNTFTTWALKIIYKLKNFLISFNIFFNYY